MTPLQIIPKKRTTQLTSIVAFIILLGANASSAQKTNPDEPSDPHTRTIQQSIALMEQSKWQQTLNLLNPLIEKNKNTGLRKHGAKFATTYYYKGLCLLKLGQEKAKQQEKTATEHFTAAIEAFNQCHDINPPDDPSNIYRAKSLLLRGNAQQALRKYPQAIASYQQFLLERNAALDPYQLSEFQINLAICHWKNPQKTPADTTEAIRLLQQSLIYTGRNKPSPATAITALRILTDIATTTQREDLIPATIQHTRNTSPGNLILPADTAPETLTTLSRLITETANQNLPQSSLHLTTLIPHILVHATELGIPASITEQLTIQTTPPPPPLKNNPTIATALQARAHSYQIKGNLPSLKQAIRLYTLLLEQYPATPHQPENLYNLTRIAAKTGHPDYTQIAITRARQFLDNYPNHHLKTPTLIILLNTHFHNQQYQEALLLAEQTLHQLKTTPTDPTDPAKSLHDTASYIHAASHYYLGNFTTAAPLLTTHQATYPESPHQTATTYLTAAVQNQLQQFETSIPLLRDFINQQTTDHPVEPSIYTPFASYEIAYAHYSQRHLHTTILSLLPFTLDIPIITAPHHKLHTTSQISPQATILLGNTHLLLREYHTAVTHYQTAIQKAIDTSDTSARDEAYYLLIDLLGKPLWDGLTNHRLQEAIPYYLHFTSLENAKKSPYYTQILTSAITALEKADPTKPVHPLLAENLFKHNNTPNTPGIETTLKTYLYYLHKEEKTTEEILQHLTETIETTNSAYHQALIIIAKIQTLETAHKLNPEAKHIQPKINQHYQTIISQYRTEDLDNFTKLKIATHLSRPENINLTEANSYFQSIITSNSSIKKTEARLGIATQLANSENPTDRQAAKTKLTQILSDPFTPPTARETAHYHILKLHAQTENWQQLEASAISYLKYHSSVKIHALQVRTLLAKAYDRQNKTDLAIGAYTHIYLTSLFSIQNSAPAIHRTCQLLWLRDRPPNPSIQEGKSDRQLAYETAYKYIRQTRKHFALRKTSLKPATIRIWQQIKTNAIETYPRDPKVNPFTGKP